MSTEHFLFTNHPKLSLSIKMKIQERASLYGLAEGKRALVSPKWHMPNVPVCSSKCPYFEQHGRAAFVPHLVNICTISSHRVDYENSPCLPVINEIGVFLSVLAERYYSLIARFRDTILDEDLAEEEEINKSITDASKKKDTAFTLRRLKP